MRCDFTPGCFTALGYLLIVAVLGGRAVLADLSQLLLSGARRAPDVSGAANLSKFLIS